MCQKNYELDDLVYHIWSQLQEYHEAINHATLSSNTSTQIIVENLLILFLTLLRQTKSIYWRNRGRIMKFILTMDAPNSFGYNISVYTHILRHLNKYTSQRCSFYLERSVILKYIRQLIEDKYMSENVSTYLNALLGLSNSNSYHTAWAPHNLTKRNLQNGPQSSLVKITLAILPLKIHLKKNV